MASETMGNHTCPECGRLFQGEAEFNKHADRCNKSQQKYSCSVCGKKFSFKHGLAAHEKRHSKMAPLFGCSFCKKLFANKWTAMEHEKIHQTDENTRSLNKCPECGKVYVFKNSLKTHMQIHKPGNVIICLGCKKGFKSVPTCYSHRKRCKQYQKLQEQKSNESRICVKENGLRNKESVKKIVETDLTKLLHKCQLCEKAFAVREHLNDHVDAVHDPFSSMLDQESIDSSSGSSDPAKRQSTNKTKCYFICPFCAKSCSSLNTLKSHGKQNHPFEFQTRRFLQQQLTISATSGVSVCPHCDKHIEQSKAMQTHIKKEHTDAAKQEMKQSNPRTSPLLSSEAKTDMKQTCNTCFLKFRNRRDLYRHKQVHVNKQPSQCSACNATFPGIIRLKCHMRVCKESKKSPTSKKNGGPVDVPNRQISTKLKRNAEFVKKIAVRKTATILPYTRTLKASRHVKYFCSVCGKVLHRYADLCSHFLSQHVDESGKDNRKGVVTDRFPSFKCSHCNFVAMTEYLAVSHITTVHGSSEQVLNLDSEMNSQSGECSEKLDGIHKPVRLCNKVSLTKRHSKRYKCLECDLDCKTARNFNLHKKLKHSTRKTKSPKSEISGRNEKPVIQASVEMATRTRSMQKGNKNVQTVTSGNEEETQERINLRTNSTRHSSPRTNVKGRFQRLSCECEICGMEFAWKNSYIRHVETIHKKFVQFSCGICSEKNIAFNNFDSLLNHFEVNHTESSITERDIMFKVSSGMAKETKKSNKPTQSKESRNNQTREIKFGQTFEIQTPRKSIECNFAGFYACEICSRTFSRKASLLNHMNLVHDNDDGRYSSEKGSCGKKRVRCSEPDKEKTVQSTGTQYKCAECMFVTRDLTLLVSHARKEHPSSYGMGSASEGQDANECKLDNINKTSPEALKHNSMEHSYADKATTISLDVGTNTEKFQNKRSGPKSHLLLVHQSALNQPDTEASSEQDSEEIKETGHCATSKHSQDAVVQTKRQASGVTICEFCGERHNSLSALTDHMLTSHPDQEQTQQQQVLPCPSPKTEKNSRVLLKSTVVTKWKSKQRKSRQNALSNLKPTIPGMCLQCSLCDYISLRLCNVKRHFNLRHRHGDFSAVDWDNSWKPVSELSKQDKMKITDDGKYNCNICEQTFRATAQFRTHMQDIHKIKLSDAFNPSDSILKVFGESWDSGVSLVCLSDGCGAEFESTRKNKFLRHKIVQHKEHAGWVCDLCDLTFTGLDKFKQHIGEYHSPELMVNVQLKNTTLIKNRACIEPTICNACFEMFYDKDKVSTHDCIPDTVRFYCSYCEHSSGDLTSVKHHITSSHGIIKPVQMENYEFTSDCFEKDALVAQVNLHTETSREIEGPYVSILNASGHVVDKTLNSGDVESSLKLLSLVGSQLATAAKDKSPSVDPHMMVTGTEPNVDPHMITGIEPHVDPHMITGTEPDVDPHVITGIEPNVDSHMITGIEPDVDPHVITGTEPHVDPHVIITGTEPHVDPHVITGTEPNIDPHMMITGPEPHADQSRIGSNSSTNALENETSSADTVSGVHFVCRSCDKTFEDKKSLKYHMLSHSTSNVCVCGECGKAFGVLSRLKIHMQSHRKRQTKFSCKQCSKGFNLLIDLSRHQNTHTGNQPFQCDQCGRRYGDRKALTRHQIVKHGYNSCSSEDPAEKAVCEICGEILLSQKSLQNHTLSEHTDNIHECNVCHKKFKTLYACQRHMKHAVHPDQRLDKFINQVRQTDSRIATSQDDRHEYKSVLRSLRTVEGSTEKKVYTCRLCGKQFKSTKKITGHMRRYHVDNSLKTFSCHECGQGFIRRSELGVHMRSHLDIRPYTCRICHKKYKQLGHIRDHMKSHSNTFMFPCSLCPKTLKSQSSLRGHVLSHCLQLPYKCPICPAELFKTISALIKHCRSHFFTDVHGVHNVQPIQCSMCPQCLPTVEGLCKHLVDHTDDLLFNCETCGTKFSKYYDLYYHKEKDCTFTDAEKREWGNGLLQNQPVRVSSLIVEDVWENIKEQYDTDEQLISATNAEHEGEDDGEGEQDECEEIEYEVEEEVIMEEEEDFNIGAVQLHQLQNYSTAAENNRYTFRMVKTVGSEVLVCIMADDDNGYNENSETVQDPHQALKEDGSYIGTEQHQDVPLHTNALSAFDDSKQANFESQAAPSINASFHNKNNNLLAGLDVEVSQSADSNEADVQTENVTVYVTEQNNPIEETQVELPSHILSHQELDSVQQQVYITQNIKTVAPPEPLKETELYSGETKHSLIALAARAVNISSEVPGPDYDAEISLQSFNLPPSSSPICRELAPCSTQTGDYSKVVPSVSNQPHSQSNQVVCFPAPSTEKQVVTMTDCEDAEGVDEKRPSVEYYQVVQKRDNKATEKVFMDINPVTGEITLLEQTDVQDIKSLCVRSESDDLSQDTDAAKLHNIVIKTEAVGEIIEEPDKEYTATATLEDPGADKKLVSLNYKIYPHLYNHGDDSLKNFKCEFCGKKFRTKKYVQCHIRRQHTPDDEKPHQCGTCGKGFSLRQNLVSHERIHTGSKPYKCNECGKAFRQLGHLVSHIRAHRNYRPYRCKACQIGFVTGTQLRAHLLTHNSEKEFKCSFCPAMFTSEYSLLRHRVTHAEKKKRNKILDSLKTGSDPVAAPSVAEESEDVRGEEEEEDKGTTTPKPSAICHICGKVFSYAYTLKQHYERSHSEAIDRVHQCDQCDKRFSSKLLLKQHSKKHSPAFPCHLCGVMVKKMSSHLRSAHSVGETKYNCPKCNKEYDTKRQITNHVAVCCPDVFFST